MAKFTVDSELIHTAVGTAQLQIEDIRSGANQLTSGLTNLQSSWSGQAQQSFQAHVDNWKQFHAQLEENMTALNQALAAAGEHYGTAESDVVRMFAM